MFSIFSKIFQILGDLLIFMDFKILKNFRFFVILIFYVNVIKLELNDFGGLKLFQNWFFKKMCKKISLYTHPDKTNNKFYSLFLHMNKFFFPFSLLFHFFFLLKDWRIYVMYMTRLGDIPLLALFTHGIDKGVSKIFICNHGNEFKIRW